MFRLFVGMLLSIALAGPAAANWAPVAGRVPGTPAAAATDGPRILVVSAASSAPLAVSTIGSGRVRRRQVIVEEGPVEAVRWGQVVATPGGGAVLVWEMHQTVLASFRPGPDAPFGPPRRAARYADGHPGVAHWPRIVVTTSGEAVLAWWGGPAAGRLGVYTASMTSSGAWGEAIEASAGVYPQVARRAAPWLGVAVAADPAGGIGIAWRQPDNAAAESIMGVTRRASGAWGSPARLGRGRIGRLGLAAAAPSPGELVATWPEQFRPDAATSRGCAVAATLREGSVRRDEVICRDGAEAGRTRVAAVGDGRVVMGGEFITPDLTSDIEVSARDPAGTWSPPRTAVTGAVLFAGLAPLASGRAVLTAVTVSFERYGPLRFFDLSGSRVVLVGPDGAPERRIAGDGDGSIARVISLGPDERLALLGSVGSGRMRLLTDGP